VAALAAATAVVIVGRPVGIGLAVVAIALVVAGMVVAKRRDAWSLLYAAAAIGLAGVAALRSAGWVVWPSVLAALALASLAAAGGRSWVQLGAGLAHVLRFDAGVALARPAASARPPAAAIRGVALGAVLLAVFVPLFATADAAFAQLLDQAVPDNTFDRPVARIAAALAILGVGGALLRAATAPRAKQGPPAARTLATLEWVVPLAALVTLFAAFVAVQLATLYGGHEHVLETAGLTYAEYAREGFAQLIAAAALTLAVIGAAGRWAPPAARPLLIALCLLTFVILASALTRLGLYEEAYGFTRLRFSAHAAILWLGGLFALVVIALALKRARWLPRATVSLTAAATLAFGLADPDRRVAANAVERYEDSGRIDPVMLAQLSPDAAPALAKLPAALASCLTLLIRGDLATADGLAGANIARTRARDALAGLEGVTPQCTAPRR
jgi:hypothetical protein